MQPPQNRANLSPLSIIRYFKCQGLGHIVANCPNRKVIALAEWEAAEEHEIEEENEEDVEVDLEET